MFDISYDLINGIVVGAEYVSAFDEEPNTLIVICSFSGFSFNGTPHKVNAIVQ